DDDGTGSGRVGERLMAMPRRQMLTLSEKSREFSVGAISRLGRPGAYSAFPQHRLIVQVPSDSWWKNIDLRLNDLAALDKNWDGYGGLPVSYTCAAFAGQILQSVYFDGLPVPSLVPGSDGTL